MLLNVRLLKNYLASHLFQSEISKGEEQVTWRVWIYEILCSLYLGKWFKRWFSIESIKKKSLDQVDTKLSLENIIRVIYFLKEV